MRINRKLILSCCLGASLVLPLASIAGTHDDNFKAGMPFNELVAAIEANSTEILILQETTTQLRTELDTLANDVELLIVRVGGNETMIRALRKDVDAQDILIRANIASIESIEANILVLEADVLTNGAEIDSLNLQLGDLKAQVELDMVNMSAEVTRLADALNEESSKLSLLQDLVKTNKDGINTQIKDLNEQLITLGIEFNARLDVTLVEQAAHNDQVNDIQTQLIDLNATFAQASSDLSDLETAYVAHKHAFEDIYEIYNHVHVEVHRHVTQWPHTHTYSHDHCHTHWYTLYSFDHCETEYHSYISTHYSTFYHNHLTDHEHVDSLEGTTSEPII